MQSYLSHSESYIRLKDNEAKDQLNLFSVFRSFSLSGKPLAEIVCMTVVCLSLEKRKPSQLLWITAEKGNKING